MFTGIITDIGTISEIAIYDGGMHASISSSFTFREEDIGASISCNGACLTVTGYDGGEFMVDISQETLAHTTIMEWRIGSQINLERAMKLGDEMGGHMVTGHVDGVGRLVAQSIIGDNLQMQFEVADEFIRFIAQKGSITINGVSLTVNIREISTDEVANGALFCVNLVPHTLKNTTLGLLKIGDNINFEVDIIARYVLNAGI